MKHSSGAPQPDPAKQRLAQKLSQVKPHLVPKLRRQQPDLVQPGPVQKPHLVQKPHQARRGRAPAQLGMAGRRGGGRRKAWGEKPMPCGAHAHVRGRRTGRVRRRRAARGCRRFWPLTHRGVDPWAYLFSCGAKILAVPHRIYPKCSGLLASCGQARDRYRCRDRA